MKSLFFFSWRSNFTAIQWKCHHRSAWVHWPVFEIHCSVGIHLVSCLVSKKTLLSFSLITAQSFPSSLFKGQPAYSWQIWKEYFSIQFRAHSSTRACNKVSIIRRVTSLKDCHLGNARVLFIIILFCFVLNKIYLCVYFWTKVQAATFNL